MEPGIEPIRLQPVFSRYLALWLAILHLLSLLVIWLLPLYLSFKILLSLSLGAFLIWQIRYHLLRVSRTAIREILLDADGAWWLVINNGAKLPGVLLPESFVKPWLIVLNFRTQALYFPRSVILPPDSLNPDLARRLRIFLLQCGLPQGSEPLS